MKNKITLGLVAASFTALTMFSGCSADGTEDSADSSSSSSSFSMIAADGYIVKLNAAATMTCGNMVYSTDTNVMTNNGVLVFNGLSSATGCSISVPRDAIVDTNGDNVYTSADENNTLNYEMRADGEDTIISQFTTLVQDFITQGKSAEATALRAVVKDFNPVASIIGAASDNNATRAKSIQLMVLGEAIKVIKKTGASSAATTELNATSTLSLIENNSTVPNIAAITASVTTPSVQTAIDSKCEIIATVVDALKDIVDSTPNQTTDITQVIIAISDGGATATDALNSATTDADGDPVVFDATGTDLNTTTLDANISAAVTELETAVTSTPALLTLGSTLKLGNLSIGLSSTGTFTSDVDVSSTSTLADFSSIVLPGATITKSFVDQNITLSAHIVNAADSSDEVNATFGDNLNYLVLIAGDNDVSAKVRIPGSAPIILTDTINGAEPSEYTGTFGTTQTNEDLSFDACTAINGCTGNDAVTAMNDHLKVAGKTYNVTISISGINPAELATNYTTITGTITTK